MIWSDYWNALSARQRLGLGAGTLLIAAATAGLAFWLLRDPYVTLAAGLNGAQTGELAHQLDGARLAYRVGEAGDAVLVARSDLGKARAAVAGSPLDAPASVGLELFKETDFSSTDFAQRINYQRALQGELTRTIETIAGVQRARVHVILADTGVFKRDATKASAAVSVTLQPGKVLAQSQVRGIQRLVAASVPDIRNDDVVVLDDTGTSLSRRAPRPEGDASSAQLELKREADQYLESKLARLLQELVPEGDASLSVDTTLDEKQLRVTTDEPISHASNDTGRAAGVLVRERQSQRGHALGVVQVEGDAGEDNTDVEYEYKVGNRVEQILSAPGSIKRISVAVALKGAPAGLTGAAVEDLVVHAVGVDRARGDSVAVLLLPAASAPPAPPAAMPAAAAKPSTERDPPQRIWIAGACLLAASLLVLWWRRPRSKPEDVDAAVERVRRWLDEGVDRGAV